VAKYRVKRTFPCPQKLVRGQIFEDPPWRNLPYLVRQGYLEEVPDGGKLSPPETVIPDKPSGASQVLEAPVIEEMPASVETAVEETAVEEIQAGESQTVEEAPSSATKKPEAKKPAKKKK
jgi:hypothetical protein